MMPEQGKTQPFYFDLPRRPVRGCAGRPEFVDYQGNHGKQVSQICTTGLRGKRGLRMCTVRPETTGQDIRETVDRLTQARVVQDCRNARSVQRAHCFGAVPKTRLHGQTQDQDPI